MGINTIEGKTSGDNYNIAVVVSRWNALITERLKEGSINALVKHGVSEDHITVVYCPGAYEIPLVTKTLLDTKRYEGVVCLGAVIRGDTPHFEYVCNTVNNGIAGLNISKGIPVAFGVLTTNNVEQAMERSDTESGNKGEEAAVALLEMISLIAKIKQ